MDVQVGDKKFKFKNKILMKDWLKQMAKTDPKKHENFVSVVNLISSASIDGKFNLQTIKEMEFAEGMTLVNKTTEKFGLNERLNFLAEKSND